MKVNSKKPTRFLGIFVLSMIVAMSFSCKKEKVEPANNTNPAGGTTTAALVAKANLNFVDDLEVLDFECHKRKNYQEVELHGDSVMYLKFNSVNNLGKKVEGPLLLINMKSHNGFFTGQVFRETDDPTLQKFSIQAIRSISDGYSYAAGNENAHMGGSTAEVKITSFDGNNIKGTFSFIAFTSSNPGPAKKLIISNGEFESKIN